jgi:hypothetical protein
MSHPLARHGAWSSLLATLVAMLGVTISAGREHIMLQVSNAQRSGDQPAKVLLPEQPLPFSHKRHSTLHLPCKSCHANPEPGNLMTLPATEMCMSCHEIVAKDRPAIQKLAKYAQTKQPIPWVRFYAVPGFVYWSHRTHSDAGVSCVDCHGEVAEMETIRLVTKVTAMEGCVDCHRRKEATTGCAACHETRLS